jgi:hypothetical protein
VTTLTNTDEIAHAVKPTTGKANAKLTAQTTQPNNATKISEGSAPVNAGRGSGVRDDSISPLLIGVICRAAQEWNGMNGNENE